MMVLNLNYHVFYIISQYITDRIYQLYVVLRNKHSMSISPPCPHLTMFEFPGKCTLVGRESVVEGNKNAENDTWLIVDKNNKAAIIRKFR